MMKIGNAKQLAEFIENSPSLGNDGKPEPWGSVRWITNLDRDIPNWRRILSESKAWGEIKDIKPRQDYYGFLRAALPYAPPETIKDYLETQDDEKRKAALESILEEDARTLTIELWKHLDYDTKLRIIIRILKKIKQTEEDLECCSRGIRRTCFRYLEGLDWEIRMDRLGYLDELLYRRHWILRTEILDIILHQPDELLDPLLVKLKAITRISKDQISLKIISEFEEQIRKKIERTEKLASSFASDLRQKEILPSSESKDVMFDPSLVMNTERLNAAVRFMKEHSKEFTFHISNAFYNSLMEYDDSGRWSAISTFFKQEIDHRETIVSILKENRKSFAVYSGDERTHAEKYPYFLENLRREIEEPSLRNIILEEWDFLQRHSWVVSRSKEVFETFKDCGVVAIEFSGEAIDRIIRRTLRKEEGDFIDTFEKLKALGKWIAMGVSSASSLVSPSLAFFLMFGSQVFILLDPADSDREESSLTVSS